MSENCGREDCGICVREDVFTWGDGMCHIVTYIGDYVVITTGAPEHDTIVGLLYSDQIPEFITLVGYVGEGSVKESEKTVSSGDYPRWVIRHDDFENGPEMHDMVYEGVRDQLIDVSVPLTDDEYRDMYYEGTPFGGDGSNGAALI